MKRNPRKVKWTKAFRKAAGKEMAVDSVFEFEKRRHVPVKYDRNLVSTTVSAIKRVQEIRTRRESQFIKNRLKKGKVVEKAAVKRLIEQNIELISSPVVRNKALEQKVAALSKRMEVE